MSLQNQISIHALREEGDRLAAWQTCFQQDFYPRPPRGGRPVRFLLLHVQQDFYPRPPRGGRPATALHRGKAAVFLSTPSARRATGWLLGRPVSSRISIHALREEGDVASQARLRPSANFYPRPPRGGRQYLQYDNSASQKDFYPRPPRGGRRQQQQGQRQGLQISIHALREEGDNRGAVHDVDFQKFLSTPSARRATCRFSADCGVLRNFYPRPPRGGRRAVNALLSPFKPISIHALREEGDHTTTKQEDKNHISIHALREEGDY